MPLLYWGDEPPRPPVATPIWLFCRTCLVALPLDRDDPTAAITAAVWTVAHDDHCPGKLMSYQPRSGVARQR